jgi:coenzyme F420-reducing hydrogenase delta subunit
MVKARIGYIHEIMEKIGLERERLELCNLATNNGVKFAETVRGKYEDLKRLGPSPVK